MCACMHVCILTLEAPYQVVSFPRHQKRRNVLLIPDSFSVSNTHERQGVYPLPLCVCTYLKQCHGINVQSKGSENFADST